MRLLQKSLPLAWLGLGLVSAHAGAAAEPPAPPLEALARRMMSDGLPNRVPSPAAEALGLEPDAPVHHAEIGEKQATDGFYHSLSVLVELSTATPRRPIRPIGVVFMTHRVSGRQGDDHLYRARLDGTLERAILIDGEVDEAGRNVKGSGKITQEDIESPEVKRRFRHELDFWLKRRYLRKEWRSAEFSGGVLKKKGKAQ